MNFKSLVVFGRFDLPNCLLGSLGWTLKGRFERPEQGAIRFIDSEDAVDLHEEASGGVRSWNSAAAKSILQDRSKTRKNEISKEKKIERSYLSM